MFKKGHFLSVFFLLLCIYSKASSDPIPVAVDLHDDRLPDGAVGQLGTTRFRHGCAIDAVAFAHENIVITSGNAWIRFWNGETGRELRGIHMNVQYFTAMTISSDRKKLAAVAHFDDRADVIVWDVESRKELKRWVDHKDSFSGIKLAFSHDGKTLVAGEGSKIRIWDIETERDRAFGTAEEFDARSVAYTANDRALLVESNSSLFLHDSSNGKVLQRYGKDCCSAVLLPDGNRMAFLGAKEIQIQELSCGKTLHSFTKTAGRFSCLCASPDGKKLAAWGNSIVAVWDIESGRELHRFPGRAFGYRASLQFAPDGTKLAVENNNGLDVWDLKSGLQVIRAEGHNGGVESIVISPNGKIIATRDESDIQLWHASTGKQILRISDLQQTSEAISFSPDGEFLAGWHTQGQWDRPSDRFWRAEDGVKCDRVPIRWKNSIYETEKAILRATQITEFDRYSSFRPVFAITTDGRKMISMRDGLGPIKTWTGTPLNGQDSVNVLPSSDQAFLAITNDGTTFAVAPRGRGYFQIIRPDHQNPILQLGNLEPNVTVLSFSANGRMLASGEIDGTVRIWEVFTGKERKQLRGHRGPITSLAFSPNGRILMSGGSDTSVLMWPLAGYPINAKQKEFDPKALVQAWNDLAAEDATKAYRAMSLLASSPGKTVPFLRERLQLLGTEPDKTVVNLIADLGSDRFAVRDNAAKKLLKLHDCAEPLLRRIVTDKNPPDLEVWLVRILTQLDRAPISSDCRRAKRLIETLELLDEMSLLREVATNSMLPWAIREARMVIERRK